MFDTGALGTLAIGLDAIRHEEELYARGVAKPSRPRRQGRQMRQGIAAFLRRTAAAVEPAPMPAR